MRREGDMGKDEREGWSTSKEGVGGKTIIAIVALVVLVIFGLQNTDPADIDFLFWDVEVALVLVIAVAALLGFVIGWLLGRASGKRRAIERISTD